MRFKTPLVVLIAVVATATAAWPWLRGGRTPVPHGARLAPPEAPTPREGNLAAEIPRVPLAQDLRDFDTILESLVALGTELSSAAEELDRKRAEDLDRQSRIELEALYRRFPEPEQRALQKLTGLPSTDATLAGQVRRRVCILLVSQGLERRWRQRAGGTRQRLDSLVAGMLAALPSTDALADELSGLLVDQPYLGLAHEEAVLDLLAMTSELPFLREVSAALLITLWDNLRASGARTDGELASLALMFKDDVNPTKRLAALVHLLTADGGRYRDLAVDEVCARQEESLARELGMAAARNLEPPAALEVLERLATVSSEALMPGFVRLGLRDPDILRDAYERRLADDRQPQLRAELVTGAGFTRAGTGLARLAFQLDPHPGVKTRAMLTLTANAAEAWGEATLDAALDDPEFCADPQRLGAVVWALDNLANKGMANAVQRLGSRLMTHGGLLAGDRDRLAEILAR